MRQTLLLILLFIATYVQSQVLVINEVDADNPSTDTEEFIELKSSTANMALDGYVVVLFNGSNDASYNAIDLDGKSTDANGLFVIGTSGVSPTADFLFSASSNAIQNGADAIAIYQDDATNFPNGTAVTATNLIDAFVYDTNDGDDAGLMATLSVSAQYNEGAAGDKDNHSNQRKADGTYEAKEPSPSVLNDGGGVTTPTITISTSASSYEEGDDITIVFTISENVSSDLNISYTLVNGAFDVADYTGALSATISTGTSTTSNTITIVDDSEDEGTENLVVIYDNLDPGYKATNDNYSIAIIDNDFAISNYGTPLAPTYDVISSTASGNYYESLDGLSGQALKNAITAIIADASGVKAQTYGDVWDMLKEADQNPENNSEIWLLYSEIGRAKTEQQGSGSSVGKWNREHIYPQSRGGFSGGTSTSANGKDVFMTTDATHTEHGHADAHALRPCDPSVNSSRGNNDFGDEYDGPTGNAGSWKGDVARSLMYMALRYDALDIVSGNPDNSTVGEVGDLTYLLSWHSSDIPDDYEMHRNNVVYDWQGNRNPFIDLPELAAYVYGDKVGTVFNLTTDINEVIKVKGEFYPNPVNEAISFTNVSNGKVSIYSATGAIVLQEEMTTGRLDLTSISRGIYFYQVESNEKVYIGKFLKK